MDFIFEQYSSAERRILASRMQFPLDLCFGMTIHKAQGMTLNAAMIHCREAFGPGQVSVAIGWEISSANLQIFDLRKNYVEFRHIMYLPFKSGGQWGYREHLIAARMIRMLNRTLLGE